MKKTLLALTSLACAVLACNSGPRSSAGFRLPDGDPQAGRAAFVDMRCHACHDVAGDPGLPAPTADPPVGVTLGGIVPQARTDGGLVTSIINPSHEIAKRPAVGVVSAGSRSRMGSFGDVMTTRQLADVVAFLQSRYVVRPPPMPRAG